MLVGLCCLVSKVILWSALAMKRHQTWSIYTMVGTTTLTQWSGAEVMKGLPLRLVSIVNLIPIKPLYTISGNLGTSGATVRYLDGTLKIVGVDASGNYSITVPAGWKGTVTPYKAGQLFTSASRTYNNVQSNQTAQNFTAQVCASCADAKALIGGNLMGAYSVNSAIPISSRYGINWGLCR